MAFRPGGAGPVLGLPPGELVDAHTPLESVWGPAAGEVLDRVDEARSGAARVRAVEDVLLAGARPSLEPHPAVAG